MNLLLHLHPRMVPAEALSLPRTFGLGGMALVLFGVLVATGALLLLAYDPSTERAWDSVAALQDRVPFGGFIRGIHHHAGNGLLVLAALHLLRVFYTGAILPPRRPNWLVGLALLVLVMAGNFTGYLLPWDQLSYWAVTIGTGMLQYVPLVGEALVHLARGGAEVGPRTLSIFFSLHLAVLPLLLFLLISFHFWLVRKAGGVMLPELQGRRPALVPVRPHLTLREGVAALVLLAALFTVAALVPAPLEDPANPGMSPNPAKAPWYFMGIQELLVHLHPALTILGVPLAGGAFLLGLSFLAYPDPPSGRWFHSDRGRRAAVLAALAALVLTPVAVVLDERVLRWTTLLPSLPPLVTTGLVPVALWGGVLVGVVLALRKVLSLSRFEVVQAVFTFLAASFLVLTAVGVFFRGPEMRLGWPW